MAFIIRSWTSRSPHLLQNMNETEKCALEQQYAIAKSYGVRACLAVLSGSGGLCLAKEAGKGVITYYGKRWIGGTMVVIGGYLGFGGIPLLTNATKVVGYAKSAHAFCATVMDATESTAGLPLTFVELAVFGRPVQKSDNSTFNLYPNGTDILS